MVFPSIAGADAFPRKSFSATSKIPWPPPGVDPNSPVDETRLGPVSGPVGIRREDGTARMTDRFRREKENRWRGARLTIQIPSGRPFFQSRKSFRRFQAARYTKCCVRPRVAWSERSVFPFLRRFEYRKRFGAIARCSKDDRVVFE